MIAPIESYRRNLQQHGRAVADESGLIEHSASSGSGVKSTVKRLVGDHPTVAVTMAVGVGLLVGWIVKRRTNG